MLSALKNIIGKNIFHPAVAEKGSVEAYDLWAENYDAQPGNLMLDMDEVVFGQLLKGLDISGKSVADIGCGTGRHWAKMLRKNPESLTGFDVSAGMLTRLKQKFPDAHTYQITDDRFTDIPDATYDAIVSTLTVAHIENIAESLQVWSRILKPQSDIIITDFHPNALAFGGKRTFTHNDRSISIKNFVHYVYDIEEILLQYGFRVVNSIEREVDDSVKHYYEAKRALPVFEKFKGSRIIYGIHLRRGYDTE